MLTKTMLEKQNSLIDLPHDDDFEFLSIMCEKKTPQTHTHRNLSFQCSLFAWQRHWFLLRPMLFSWC